MDGQMVPGALREEPVFYPDPWEDLESRTPILYPILLLGNF